MLNNNYVDYHKASLVLYFINHILMHIINIVFNFLYMMVQNVIVIMIMVEGNLVQLMSNSLFLFFLMIDIFYF
jgi:hypothetical protein